VHVLSLLFQYIAYSVQLIDSLELTLL